MTQIDRHEVAPSWGRRLDGIEGLRGLAAFSVLAGHTFIILRATSGPALLGDLTGLLLQGLTLFFVLSGFLLYRSYAAAVLGDRAIPRTRDFLINRVLRIWPAYLVILVVVGFVLGTAVVTTDGPGAVGSVESDFGRMTDPVLFLANAFLLQGWFPSTSFTGLSVSWSLLPEVSFYLLLPLFGALAVWLARRFGRITAVITPALVLLAVAEVGRITSIVLLHQSDVERTSTLLVGPTWNAVLYRSIFSQGDLFALGMLAAVAVVASDSATARTITWLRRIAWASIVLGALAVLVLRSDELITPFMGLICAGGIAILRLPRPGGFARGAVRVLETMPLRAAGLCSYSVYLWHFPIIWFLRIHVDASRYSTAVGLLISLAMVSACTIILAAITYRLVELPAMRRKRRTASEPGNSLHGGDMPLRFTE